MMKRPDDLFPKAISLLFFHLQIPGFLFETDVLPIFFSN